jgi:hypothetical protein
MSFVAFCAAAGPGIRHRRSPTIATAGATIHAGAGRRPVIEEAEISYT